MKGIRKAIAVTVVIAGIFGAAVSGFSYAYDPWTGMTGDKTLSVNPFFHGGISPFSWNVDTVVAYGFASNIDVIADLATFGTTGYGGSWIMPRYDFASGVIGALQLGYFGGSSLISPQFHYFTETDYYAIEFNAYVNLNFAGKFGYTVGAYAAPVWKVVTNFLYVFVEIDPTYDSINSFTLPVIPGICFNMGSAGQLSLGLNLGNVLSFSTKNFGFNAWYAIPFTIKL